MENYKDTVLFGDALTKLKELPDGIAQMCVTSPPYWGLRDYDVNEQLGLEETPELYVNRLTRIFNELNRVLKDDGTLWLNLGDSYFGGGRGSGGTGELSAKQNTNKGANFHVGDKAIKWPDHDTLKTKDLVGVPWRVAFALQKDGWYLRSDIIWHKPNPMPESVKDRPTNAHEYIFLLSKSKSYYYDWDAIAEERTTDESRPDGCVRNRIYDYDSKRNENPEAYLGNPDQSYRGQKTKGEVPNNGMQQRHGEDMSTDSDKKNKRSVWSINTKPFPEAHFAVYPPQLIAPCIKAGSKQGDIVLDPFFGSGTTGEVAMRLNRHYLGIELNEDYKPIQDKRLSQKSLRI